MKEIKSQDIENIICKLEDVTIDGWCIETDQPIIDSAIYMLKELGNLVHDLQLDIISLKQEILQLEAMIDD